MECLALHPPAISLPGATINNRLQEGEVAVLAVASTIDKQDV